MHSEKKLNAVLEAHKKDLKQRVLDYCEDILSGRIVSCVKLRWSIERFLDDLARTEDERYLYYMDWNELLKIYEWAKLFQHTKGVLAGQPIELHVSQMWEAVNILGFKNKKTGFRRFREAYIQKARKNAKTQFLAIVCSYIGFNSKELEEIYIAGWTRIQSEICYNEILAQLKRSSFKKDTHYSDSYKKLTILRNDSTIIALSKEARNTGDGTNPSVNVIDEYGTAHKTNEIVDVQKSGMVSRPNGLTVYITTPGFDLSVPCYEFYNYCSDIINPENNTENEDIFVAIYELDENDDIKNEDNWIKSNPIVATFEAGLNFLRSELKIALDQPPKMRNFLTKNMGIWVDQKEEGFLSLERWNKQVMAEIDEFIQGSHFYIGVDLSMTTDLTSVAPVFVKGGKYLVLQTSFMPEEKFVERMSRDKVRFDLFKERGELRLTEGSIVNYGEVYDFILNTIKRYTEMGSLFKEVCFDNHNAGMMMAQLEKEGIAVTDIPQRITMLSEPTKRFREELYNGNLFHVDDHLFQWSANNAILRQDDLENVSISKSRSKDRIDPMAASINAFARAMYDSLSIDFESYILSGGFGF